MPSQPISRRRALRQTFFFSAALLAGRPLLSAADRLVSAPATQHFLMLGDWGWLDDLSGQQAVARAMTEYVASTGIHPESLWLLGDNFYGPFKGGTDCPRWKEQFEDMYPVRTFPGPCYAVLGNHDYDDEPVDKLAAELTYEKAHPGTRWRLPAKWYRQDFGPAGKPLMTVLFLDSNYHNARISLTSAEKAAQMKWLEAELSKPRTAPWLVAVGHHPLYSNGTHGDDQPLIAAWDNLFRKHRVHFYFCGHDHDLQHMELDGHPTSFVVSGGGGATIRQPEHRRGPFAKGVYGFTHIEVTPERFITRHFDTGRKLLHAFEKKPDGAWKILA